MEAFKLANILIMASNLANPAVWASDFQSISTYFAWKIVLIITQTLRDGVSIDLSRIFFIFIL